jgi:hypothetical protein
MPDFYGAGMFVTLLRRCTNFADVGVLWLSYRAAQIFTDWDVCESLTLMHRFTFVSQMQGQSSVMWHMLAAVISSTFLCVRYWTVDLATDMPSQNISACFREQPLVLRVPGLLEGL